MTSIKDQPKSFRPREKLELHGIQSLTTPELISIILGSGSQKIPVHILAKRVAERLHKTPHITLQDLLSVKGMGLAKASQILAALELVERIRPRFPDEILDRLDKVLQVVSDLRTAQKEHVVGLYLDARLKLIHRELLSLGTVNESIITPRDVFAAIRHHPVVHIILAHNHPSGDVAPSTEDISFTKRMNEASHIIGIELLDHIIVGKGNHFSFKQSHLL